MRRMRTSASATDICAQTPTASAQAEAVPVGGTITSTPARPAPIAAQRRQPTVSPSIGAESAATKSGTRKVIATQSAIGISATPWKDSTIDATPQAPRSA